MRSSVGTTHAPYQLPPGIGRFVEVEEIYLPSIAINGTVPEQFTNMTTLRTFVPPNYFFMSGVIPDAISKMTELTSISFLTSTSGGQIISGTLPASVAEMSSLTELYLSGGQISGTLPASVAEMSWLTELYLDTNSKISGSLPAGFFDKLVALETVRIEGGQWTGPYPTKFASPALRSLFLGDLGNMTKSGTTLSIEVPTKGALVAVDIDANNFTSISADFVNLLNLSALSAANQSGACTLNLPDLTLDGVSSICKHNGYSYQCANSSACTSVLTDSRTYGFLDTRPCGVTAGVNNQSVQVFVNCTG